MNHSIHTHAADEPHIPGVTHDPALRPVGILMIVIGGLWALFWGMASEAGTFTEPILAAALIGVGLLFATIGKRGIEI